MRCVDCEYLKRIQKPIRFGKDIFDTGMVECTKHDLVMEYTSKSNVENCAYRGWNGKISGRKFVIVPRKDIE